MKRRDAQANISPQSSKAHTALLLCAALTVARTAPAQPQSADAPRARQAQSRFQEGVKAFSRGDFEGAHLAFLQAQAIYPRPAVLWNLALCELRTDHPLDALAHLKTFMASTASSDMLKYAELNLAEAYGRTGHLSITAPDGAHVLVDAKEIGIAPLKDPVDVVEGLHKVEVTGIGAVLEEPVTAAKGKLTEVSFAKPVTADTHIVVGGVVESHPVPVVPPPSSPVEAEHHDHTGRDVLRWGTAGLAVVGVGVGVGFWLDSRSQASDFSAYQASHPSGCASPASSVCNQARTLSSASSQSTTIETVGFVAGGVAAVSSAALWLFWPRDSQSSSSALRFTPSVGAGSYTVNMGGRF